MVKEVLKLAVQYRTAHLGNKVTVFNNSKPVVVRRVNEQNYKHLEER